MTHLTKQLTRIFLMFLFIASLTACKDTTTQAVVKKPTNAISKKRAIALSNNYTARYDSISRIIGKQDNRSTWYSLKELKDYIAYIESQGKEQGYTVDGIRFYLGAYGAENKDPNKQNFTTIFLAPTGKKTNAQTERNSDNPTSPDINSIDAFNWGTGGWPPQSTYPAN
jgi:hypothetical protein